MSRDNRAHWKPFRQVRCMSEGPPPPQICESSTTNAPIKNTTKGGDSLRRNISPTNRIKNLNWFCIGCKIIVTGITTHQGVLATGALTFSFSVACGCVVLELRCRVPVFKRYVQNRRVFKRFSRSCIGFCEGWHGVWRGGPCGVRR